MIIKKLLVIRHLIQMLEIVDERSAGSVRVGGIQAVDHHEIRDLARRYRQVHRGRIIAHDGLYLEGDAGFLF